jgi:NAD(P)-dependent dehydrogenase (short-subunit alcohol dehydrogenase family)
MAERGGVVVTGASTGIGEATVQWLARLGFHVFAGVRREEDGDRLKALDSARIEPLLLDVTDGRAIEVAARRVAERTGGGGLAGLVNNAGIAVAGPLEYLPIEDLRRQFEVNVLGQLAVTQAFLPMLRPAKGRVVNMGSISGRLAAPFLGPYAASKFALEALTDALRVELQPWGLHVAIIEPGSIDTPIWNKGIEAANTLEAGLSSIALAHYEEAIACVRETASEMGERGISPAAVAKVVAHALTVKRPKTRYVVGRDARVQATLAKFVPDRLRDRLVTRLMHVPRRGSADAE